MSFEIVYRTWPHPSSKSQYGYVPWDSEIFGFPFYQLRVCDDVQGLAEALSALSLFLERESHGKYLAFVKAPSPAIDLIQVLTAARFYPVETMVETYRDLKSFQHTPRFERLRLEPAAVEDLAHLLTIAQGAFSKGRYHLDPNLPNDRASYRYEYWLNNGLTAGDLVLVYKDTGSGKMLGFCHLREVGSGIMDFSLGAIESNSQKAGLGVMMYSECLAECQKRGYRQMVTRVSVNNIAVLNTFAHLGFKFRDPVVTLHRYCDRSAETG